MFIVSVWFLYCQGLANELLYELESGDLDFFVIHPRTGSVHVARSLADDPQLRDTYSVKNIQTCTCTHYVASV